MKNSKILRKTIIVFSAAVATLLVTGSQASAGLFFAAIAHTNNNNHALVQAEFTTTTLTLTYLNAWDNIAFGNLATSYTQQALLTGIAFEISGGGSVTIASGAPSSGFVNLERAAVTNVASYSTGSPAATAMVKSFWDFAPDSGASFGVGAAGGNGGVTFGKTDDGSAINGSGGGLVPFIDDGIATFGGGIGQGGNAGSPAILNQVVFTFTVEDGLTDGVGGELGNINNVNFLFGSDLDATPGTPGDGLGLIPEPSSMILAGMGCLGLFGYGARRRKDETKVL